MVEIRVGNKMVSGERFRQTRGGTPCIATALVKRGLGGQMFLTGKGNFAMMSPDAAGMEEDGRSNLISTRQPLVLEINEINVDSAEKIVSINPVEVSNPKEVVDQKVTDKNTGIPQIETVQIREGLKVAVEPVNYKLWKALMAEDPSLPKPYYLDSPEIGINAGINLPVVGISFESIQKALDVLEKLTGKKYDFLTEKELKESEGEIKLGENKYGSIYEWTKTNLSKGQPYKVIINLSSGGRYNNHPIDCCSSDLGVRFKVL